MDYYFEGRIEKVRKRNWKDSVFCGTWLESDRYESYKPVSEEDAKVLWELYRLNKTVPNKNKIFNNYAWYAAYIAIFACIKWNKNYHFDYEWYLSYAMKTLFEAIDLYNESESSFYTYVLNTYNLKISRELLNEADAGSTMGLGVICRYKSVIGKIDSMDITCEEALKMDPDKFFMLFGETQELFSKMYLGGRSISTNLKLSDDNEFEIIDTISDSRIDSCYDKIECDIDTENLLKIVKDLVISHSQNVDRGNRYYNIWYDYISGKYNSLEEVGTLYNITRERVRQILNKVNKLVKNNKTVKRIYEEMCA